MKQLPLFALLITSLCIAGCGSKSTSPKCYPVSGKVNMDGQPIVEGDIILTPQDPGLGPDAGKIKDGKFAFPAKAGKKRVEIRASRDVPGKTQKGAMGEELKVREQYIPVTYNANTQLTAEVNASGKSNKFDFDLHSK